MIQVKIRSLPSVFNQFETALKGECLHIKWLLIVGNDTVWLSDHL